MPLDPNIILGGKAPDIMNPMDAMTKVAAYKDLANRSQMQGIQTQQAMQDFNDNQAMRNAYMRNTSVDPNGTPSLDQGAMLRDLAKTSPHLVPQAAQNFQKMSMDMQAQKIASAVKKLDFAGQVLGGVKDQDSYEKAMKQAQSVGEDTSQWPHQWDKDWVSHAQYQSMTAKEQLEAHAKQQGLDIEGQKAKNEAAKLGVEMFKTYGSGGPGGGGGSSGSQGNGGQPVDPSILVSRVVPPDRQKQVFDEIKAAQNTAKSAPEILKNFDLAAERTSLASPKGLITNPYQGALHAIMGPTFQDVEGTVRQAAMDNMAKNTTPEYGDSAETLRTKRAALVDYLTSKSAAPTSKGFGLDLSKYPSTSVDPKILAGKSGKQQSVASHPQDSTAVQWAKSNPNDPRASKILQLNGITSTAGK